MIVVGGVVAYIADNLGRTLGKKRLTLFHMRPRHTATLITVAAGMLIPLLTVLFVAIASKDYREWLVEGHAAIQKRDALIQDVNKLADQEHRLTNVNRSLTKQSEDSQRQLQEKRKEVARQATLVAEEQRKAARLSKQLTALERNLLSVERTLRSTLATLRSTETARDQIAKKYKLAQSEYATALTSYNELKRQNDQQYLLNDQLTKQNDKLTKDVDRLGAVARDLTASNQKAQMDLDHTKFQLDTARLNLDRAGADLAFITNKMTYFQGVLQNDLNTSRFRHLMFGIGDELARVSVPAGATEEQAKGLLANLMREAATSAADHGAKPLGGSGDAAVVGLFERDREGSQAGQSDKVSPQEQENMILRSITGNKDDLVLVANAFANTFEGEWVPLDIKPYRNPLVYKRNDMVAEARINGGDSEETILQEISDFLRNTVHPKALKDNMIPVSGQEQSLGEVAPNEIYGLVKSIRDMGRPVRLAALATSDTRAGDPLQLRFRVR
jgi:hypothetical protein